MSKIAYQSQTFRPDTLEVIERAEQLATDYAAQGYDLTLRQLFYQFVSRGWLPNTQQSYKRLGGIVNDARLAGLIDWNHITDRTRSLASLPTWYSPQSILNAVSSQYRTDHWRSGQTAYVEVWVEKEALAGVVARPADRWQVPYFSCRGYVSQSEMWAAAMRFKAQERQGKRTVLIHLGDHDPSGIDMTRDIRDRMRLFGSSVEVRRIALSLEQVEQYQPPPNPAKLTDSRVDGYIEEFGDLVTDDDGQAQSWELDALDPPVLDALIDGEITQYIDMDAWELAVAAEDLERAQLEAVSSNWDELVVEMDDRGWVRNGHQPEPDGDE